MTEVLVIGGPAGVGKSTTAYEVSLRLRMGGVCHAVVDTDALDMVFPVPRNLAELTERNLASVWSAFDQLGVDRLILTGVHLHRASELDGITRAVPGAKFTLVRLEASDATLRARIRRREIGSGYDSQVERTLRQMSGLRAPDAYVAVFETDGRSVEAIAADILDLTGWLPS